MPLVRVVESREITAVLHIKGELCWHAFRHLWTGLVQTDMRIGIIKFYNWILI